MSNNPIHLVMSTYHFSLVYKDRWIEFDLRLHRNDSDDPERSTYDYSLINTNDVFQNPRWQSDLRFDSPGDAMDWAISVARSAVRREFSGD